MKKLLIIKKASLSALMLFSLSSQAASLNAYCTYSFKDGKESGKNTQKMLPLASVSKVFVTQWALAMKGPDYRFITKIYRTPVKGEAGVYNIHIKGDRDPYFRDTNMYSIVSRLNEMGITKINRLSFDEKLKFFEDVNNHDVVTHENSMNYPLPITVLAQLKKMSPFIDKGYFERSSQLKAKGYPALVANPQMSIRSIEYIESKDFKPAPSTQIDSMHSAPLVDLLREMNRNSNNHAANQIFAHLGGAEAYERYAKQLFVDEAVFEYVNSLDPARGLFVSILNKSPTQILNHNPPLKFYNGSGAPVYVNKGQPNQKKYYNEASCEAVSRVIGMLFKYMNTGNRGGLKRVLAVAGEFENHNTLKSYNRDSDLGKVLIAKTGTVSQAVTLAGVVSTKNGIVSTYFNMKTNGTKEDWSNARASIKQSLEALVDANGGGVRVKTLPFN